MPNKRTGPDFLDRKTPKKKPSIHDLVKTGRPTTKKDSGLLKKKVSGTSKWSSYTDQFDPEVLKKYPFRPTETIGVDIMRRKMQERLDKKKNKK